MASPANCPTAPRAVSFHGSRAIILRSDCAVKRNALKLRPAAAADKKDFVLRGRPTNGRRFHGLLGHRRWHVNAS
jgi:hypothetical protein